MEYEISPLRMEEIEYLSGNGFSEKEIYQIGDIIANGMELPTAIMIMEIRA